MRTHRRAIFGFLPQDYKAVQPWLEEMARQGWELERLNRFTYFNWAVFVPLSRADLRYCVDLGAGPVLDEAEQEAYDRLCADAGWHSVAARERIYIYKNEPGTDPVPIQTDGPLERKRLWQKVLAPSLIGGPFAAALLLALFFAFTWDRPLHLYMFLSTDRLLFPGLFLLALLGWSAYSFCHALLYWRRSRAATEAGAALPVPTIRGARRRAVLNAAFYLLMLFVLLRPVGEIILQYNQAPPTEDFLRSQAVLTLEALGAKGDAHAPHGDMDRTLFMDRLDIWQWGDWPVLSHQRYDCRYGWVAGLVLDGLYKDEVSGAHNRKTHTPGAMATVDLGLDAAYTAAHAGFSVLLLRQGNTVILVEGPADFTDPAVLDLVRTRIGPG